MKDLKDIILEKLIINKNIKIDKKITKDTYNTFNIIENVNKYVDMLYEGCSVNVKSEIKNFLKQYIKGKVLIYLTSEHTHGDGYKLKNEIEDKLKNEIDSFEIEPNDFSKSNFTVYEYNKQYIIFEKLSSGSSDSERILIDGNI